MGIGKAFIEFAATNHPQLFVDVNEGNPQATRFYEQMGFRVFERTKVDEQGRPFPILKMKTL